MAYLKIFPIKVTDKKALDYITNPDKTDEKLLVSSFGCSPETADLEFSMTREMAKKNGMDKGDNLAFHLIQSFKPGEVDAENAHRLGQQFADEVLKGKYEYVISTHVDKKHIHNHIIFNAASFVDHHKYVSNKRSYHKLCRISNRICLENGLATSMPTGEKGKSYKENMEYHRGTSWKAKLRVAVDKAIWTSINYEEFLQKMQLAGYEVRQGKHLSFRAPEQENFTYMKSLGSYYSEENVRIRLAKNRNKVKTPKHLSREARLYINISTYVTTGNREGFERWAKLNNLKEAARTFNYLSENNLLNYDDFRQHVSDIEASVKVADQRIAQINSELSTQKVIQKHCNSYRLCRKVIEDCKSAKNPKAYRTKHQAEYQLHDSLKKELQDLGITKIPSSNKIQKRIENLESEQAATVRENQELQKKLAHFRKVCLQRKKALLIENNDMKCKYCGAALIEKNDLCRVCQRYEKEKLRTEIVSILTSEPWLNHNDCQKYVKCDKMLFDSVKNSLKQYYYAKVYNNQSDIREEMTAVMLKTGMQPDKISEQLAQNIIKGLRRKY